MDAPRRPEDDSVFEFLVRGFAPEGGTVGAEACPGENLLAGLADGSLIPEERERLERHLLRCKRCASVAAFLPRMGLTGEGGRARTPIPREAGRREESAGAKPTWRGALRPWLAAAAVLVAVAGVAVGPHLLRALRYRPGAHSEARLIASARSLARTRPDLFGDFVPLDRAERLAAPPTLRSGGPALLYPAGKVREARPTFRWESGTGSGEYEVVLRKENGTEVWRRLSATASLAYPTDERGLAAGLRYVWEVAATGPGGEDRSQRVFEAASPEESAALGSCLGVIRGTVPEETRDLLAAHLALRRGFYSEAEEIARAYLASRPEDPIGRETLYQVLRRLGSSEAARLGVGRASPERGR
ncbi:MAG: zf-HC2 domain-containing protein [Planctomycetota bacterium]